MAATLIRTVTWAFDDVAHRADIFAGYEMKQFAPGYFIGEAWGDEGERMTVATILPHAAALQATLSFYEKK